MKIKLLVLSITSLLMSTSALATSEPNVYDELMSKTVGQYDIGENELNYSVSGQLSYTHGFGDMESGFHNSSLDLNTSSSLSYGLNATLTGGVRQVYDLESDDYKTKFDTSFSVAKDSHEFTLGYDKYLSTQVLGSKVKVNTDPSLSKNSIGQLLSDYSGFAEYNFAFQSSMLTAAVDFDGNLYGSISTYSNGTDINLHVFDAFDDLNVFLDVGHVFADSLKASIGAGLIKDQISFVADASYFLTDSVAFYGNILGDEDYASSTLGASYTYGSLVAFVEGIVELTDPRENADSKDGIMVGAKFMF